MTSSLCVLSPVEDEIPHVVDCRCLKPLGGHHGEQWLLTVDELRGNVGSLFDVGRERGHIKR